jgi:hypothetical protein
MNITRRAALRGGVAATCVAGVAIPIAEAAPSPDAQLIAWEAEIHKRIAAIDQCGRPVTDEELDDLCGPIADLEHRIAATEAHTVRGLAVKFRRLLNDRKDGDGMWTDDNVRTMLASFERLAGRAQS